MNETDVNGISDKNDELLIDENNEDVLQPLHKRLHGMLSFLDESDIVEESDHITNEVDSEDQENINPVIEAHGNVSSIKILKQNPEDSILSAKKVKSLSKKSKMKLESDTQRLIRENENIEFSYKPKQFKTINELKEMLAQRRGINNQNTISTCEEVENSVEKVDSESIEIQENVGNNPIEEICKSSDTENDIAPLRDRIFLDNSTRKLLDASSNKAQVLKSFDVIMKEKYKNANGLIELKSKEQYKEDKQLSEAFIKKLKANFMLNQESNTNVDLVIKERKGTEGIEHHIRVTNTSKCVKLAGEIDPLLSKGVTLMLPEEERQKWLTMSDRDKWNKHRSLLLAAEAEKRKAVRDERIKEMNLKDEKYAKEQIVNGVRVDDGLSDDDYEWKEEDNDSDVDSHSDSDEDSTTDKGESLNSEESNDEFGEKINRHKSKKRIIDSEEEEDLEKMKADNEILSSFDSKSSGNFLDEGLNFFDIPVSNTTYDDLFPESKSFSTTTTSSKSIDLDKSQNFTNDTLLLEQSSNRIFNASIPPDSEKSFSSIFTDKSLNDTVVMNNSVNDTVIVDTFVSDIVTMDKSLNEILSLGKTSGETLVLSSSDIDRNDELLTSVISSTDPSELLGNSIQMRFEHRKLFEFPLTEENSSNPTQLIAKRTFDTMKELFKDSEGNAENVDEKDYQDIDDVILDDDDDDDDEEKEEDGVDFNKEVQNNNVLKNELHEVVDDENDELNEDEENDKPSEVDDNTDEKSTDTYETDASDSDIEGEANKDDMESIDVDDDDEEEMLRKQVVGIKKNKNVPIDFFDEEAELSGSDAEQFGPDEDESDLDRYEEEEGDSEKLPSEGRLRRQIEKIHNRMEIDKDAQDIRYLKELYLEDGDLHLNGEGPRKKRFTWAGINDNPEEFSQYSINTGDGDDEDDNVNELNMVDLDQSLDKIEEKDDEGMIPLLEKYKKHLEKSKWIPKKIDTNSEVHQAWRKKDNTKNKANESKQENLILPTKSGVRKYGSFMSRAGLVPAPVNLNPFASTMSLKSRMQQHTFTVESKLLHQKNPMKRQSAVPDDSDNENIGMAGSTNKKYKLN